MIHRTVTRYLHMLYRELPKVTDPTHIDPLLPDRYLAENQDAAIIDR